MGLGKYPTVSLKLAREKAGEYREIAYSGFNPIDFRDTQRKGSIVFRQCAANYIEMQRPAWKSDKHRQQWQNTLATYVYPVFGDKPVNLVSDEDVLRVLEPIWIEKHETASRVRGRIEAILDYASALKHRESENPARMKGHLQNILAKRASGKQQKHHPAMPYKELPSFIQTISEIETSSSRALQFLILTGTRTSETLKAEWDEIDLDEKAWLIPGERYKTGKDLKVSLSEGALKILYSSPRVQSNPYVFMGAREGKHLSNMALLQLLRQMGYSKRGNKGHCVVHGFRSSFKDWALEETHFQNEVVNMSLGHTIENRTEAAYRRGNLFPKRTELMTAWFNYLYRRIE